MLTVERQSSSVTVRSIPRQQSVHVETSAADAAVHFRRSGCTSSACPAVPREPRSPVRRRLCRRHADLRRPVHLSERAERSDLPASAATEHGVCGDSYVAAGNALYRQRWRRFAHWQPGVTAESPQHRHTKRRYVISRRHKHATRCTYAAI